MPLPRHLQQVRSLLRDGKVRTAAGMAAELECSERTIRRCVDYLRDEEGWPLEAGKHGYVLREPTVAEAQVSSHSDIAALAMAYVTLREIGDIELGVRIRAEIARACRHADDLGGLRWETLDEFVEQRGGAGATAGDPGIHGHLTLAILNRQIIRIRYRRIEEDGSFTVEVYPHRLINRDQCWYVIAADLERGGQKAYAVPRISEVHPVASPPGFQPPEFIDHYAHAFGIWTPFEPDGTLHEVSVELRGYWARVAQERRWHPSQTLEILAIDRVRVNFRVNELVEVKSWVLRFGAAARVIAPEALREDVQAEIVGMAANYPTSADCDGSRP